MVFQDCLGAMLCDSRSYEKCFMNSGLEVVGILSDTFECMYCCYIDVGTQDEKIFICWIIGRFLVPKESHVAQASGRSAEVILCKEVHVSCCNSHLSHHVTRGVRFAQEHSSAYWCWMPQQINYALDDVGWAEGVTNNSTTINHTMIHHGCSTTSMHTNV